MITLKPKQQEALDILLDKKRVFLHWSTGSGKTLFCVYAIKDWWVREGKCLPALAVCPPGVFKSFIESLNLMGLDERYYSVVDTPKKKQDFENLRFKPFTIMSIDYMKKRENIYMSPFWRKDWNCPVQGIIGQHLKPQFIVIDESHKIKSHKTAVGKAGAWLGRINPEYMVMGSATPISKDQRDLFNQFYALDCGKRLGKDYYRFEQKFFSDQNYARKGLDGYYPKMTIKEDMVETFNNLIADITHYRDILKEKNIIMPKKKKVEIFVSKTPEQEAIYKTLLKRALLDFQLEKEKLKKKTITIQQFYTNTLSLMAVLRQVASGFVYGKEGGENLGSMRVPTNKIRALEAGIKRIPYMEKFIIWTVFKESIVIIQELLEKMNIKYALITGGVTGKKRIEQVDKFKNNPDYRAFLSNTQAGGVGLNLQQAKYAFYFSKNYSYIDKVQSEGRNFRIDSIKYHQEICEIELKTRDTIEEEIDANIHKKKEIVRRFESYLNNQNGTLSKN